jgi:CRP-like cAMP-binding protein
MKTGQHFRNIILIVSGLVKVYREDDQGNELDYDTTSAGDTTGWDISGDFRRYSDNVGDDLLFTIYPDQTEFDEAGEFTVTLSPAQSKILRTGDVFDIQLSDDTRVWTVCQGEMTMIGEVTDQEVS